MSELPKTAQAELPIPATTRAQPMPNEELREKVESLLPAKSESEPAILHFDGIDWKARAEAATAEAARLRDEVAGVLKDAELQITYLHGRFEETGSGNAVLARLRALLSSLNPPAQPEEAGE